jgi:glyoxylase-like metal-dependent hydrolase (beta-lactamase superfamily II)
VVGSAAISIPACEHRLVNVVTRLGPLAAATALAAVACRSEAPFASYAWNDGTDCSAPVPDVVEIAEDTVVFRQPLCTNFEGPFLYLFLGTSRAILFDSGTKHFDMAAPVLAKVEAYEKRHGLTSYELVVAHTHSHGDHVGGDRFFDGRPGVTLVAHTQDDVATFFELPTWPDGAARFDLGGRVLDVLPLPGHDEAHILVYDAKERLLLTGDTLYPGRLYIEHWEQFRASAKRMATFASSHDVRWILGAHIELRSETNPDGTALDYEMGAAVHPGEHTPILAPDEAQKLASLVDAQGPTPVREASQHFILSP